MEKILVLDFGGQTCQLIARRIREIGVYSEVVPGDTPVESLPLEGVKGIILSGSPYSVYDAEAPKVDPRVSSLGIPILGICYGVQQLAHLFGGKWPRSITASTVGVDSSSPKPRRSSRASRKGSSRG